MSKPELKVVRQRIRMPQAGQAGDIARLDLFAQRLSALHDNGLQAVFAEAEHSLAELAGGRSGRILLQSAVGWRDWHQLDVALDSPREEGWPAAPRDAQAEPTLQGDRLTLPVRAGSIVAWIEGIATAPDLQTMALAARYVDLAIAIAERHESAARNAHELQVLQDVATRILRSADLDEILLLVTHETKRLLASDICGVLMLEDEELVMRCSVGHFSVETAKLRMHAGVGVAGQALATDAPCGVENYIESESISQDFMPLARLEKVRSALAVPIRAREAIIGVLEVWRRRPSLYTEQDHGLLLALSGLAALAIDNARLQQSRARAAARLAEANTELAQRIRAIEDSARFQKQVVNTMLGGGALAAVATETAQHTGGTIIVLDRDLAVEVARPSQGERGERLLEGVRRIVGDVAGTPENGVLEPLQDGYLYAQPILAGGEMLGWIAWYGATEPAESTRLVLSHVCLAVAMHLLERRNMARARAQTLQEVLWDLLEGSDEVRAAALDRARELRVALKGPACVLLATLNSDSLDQEDRDALLEAVQQSELGRASLLHGVRGNQLRMLCRAGDTGRLRVLALRMIGEVTARVPHLSLAAGLSGPCADMRELPSHLREASIALEVARYRRNGAVAAYSESGVLGLLINLRSEADVRRVTREILGELMAEPDASRQMLLGTLRTFFECDCSQAATALSLGTHQKTIAYRLSKIGRLTGLKLARHQDRLLADIGTRLYFMLEME
ncbi:GAF domain-containing protein [Pseudoxanthomonas winnipegensis]|uniref:helix-turn-helix domain-containing protein n=1 Tax=Pseudoxanthomonas winnipegensis TaxID=2480810 RepID=UPI003F84B99A